MNVEIRIPMKSDFIALERIHMEATGNFDNTTERKNFHRYIQLNYRLIRIAVLKSEIIGYTLGYQVSSRKIRIYSIFVLPQFQRKQIGWKLINSFEEDLLSLFPDLRYLSVRIPQEFFNSIPFFENLGFKHISKITNYETEDLSFPFQPNPNILIRPLKYNEKDFLNLTNLEKQCFPEYWQMDKIEFKRLLESEITSFFLAFKDEHLVGYNYNTLSASKPEGHYVRIATHPKFRQKYIATSLTAMAFQWFKKHQVTRVLLSTYADSPVHNRLYQKWGFKAVGQEIIMAKQYF
ncbi:MAG: GNAT family N-acetyltransferase [Candidatus Hodarchaeota archaeon]